MAYSDFTLKKAIKDFDLKLIEQKNLFVSLPEVKISDFLQMNLEEKAVLGVTIGTEKARSEMIVTDVLVEVRRIFDRQIGLFSGNVFDVDVSRGLNGKFDFLLSLTPSQLLLNAPIVAVVEAKNEDITGGLGQCVAEMYAAQIFNKQEENEISKIYGAVTAGDDWKFLRLEEKTVSIDLDEYSITQPNKIVGILCAMIRQEA